MGGYDVLHNSPQSVPWTKHEADPVNPVFGNFLLTHHDLDLPGRGLPLIFARTYDSADRVDGPFGFGWSASFLVSISSGPGPVEIHYGDSRRDRFIPTGVVGGTTSYQADTGTYDKLIRNPDGTYTLTTPQQVGYRFDTGGQLFQVVDRDNLTTTVSRAASGYANGTGGITITDPAGRQLMLSYGTGQDQTHIVRLDEIGGLGRYLMYTYDPTRGDLATVRDVRGLVTALHYDNLHYLTQVVVDPPGLNRTLVANGYDGKGRVAWQRDGNGALAGCNPCATDITFTTTRRRAQQA